MDLSRALLVRKCFDFGRHDWPPVQDSGFMIGLLASPTGCNAHNTPGLQASSPRTITVTGRGNQ